MDYDVGRLTNTIKELERRVKALETSPRTGQFRTGYQEVADFDTAQTVVGNVWAEFTLGGPWVTVTTGRTAVVFWKAEPNINGTHSFEVMMISYVVSGATSLPPGRDGTVSTAGYKQAPTVYLSVGDAVMGFSIEDNLTPGENTFTMVGLYAEQTNSFDPVPTCGNRALLVLPLDL